VSSLIKMMIHSSSSQQSPYFSTFLNKEKWTQYAPAHETFFSSLLIYNIENKNIQSNKFTFRFLNTKYDMINHRLVSKYPFIKYITATVS